LYGVDDTRHGDGVADGTLVGVFVGAGGTGVDVLVAVGGTGVGVGVLVDVGGTDVGVEVAVGVGVFVGVGVDVAVLVDVGGTGVDVEVGVDVGGTGVGVEIAVAVGGIGVSVRIIPTTALSDPYSQVLMPTTDAPYPPSTNKYGTPSSNTSDDLWACLATARLPAVRTTPVDGFQTRISASGADCPPPTISKSPVGSNVTECLWRPVGNRPCVVHCPVAGSNISTISGYEPDAVDPPTTAIRPFCSTVAV
jgi:hypothetical protein